MYLKNSSDSFTNLEFSESTNLLTNIYDDFFFNFQTEKKKTVLDQFDFCFLFQLLKLRKKFMETSDEFVRRQGIFSGTYRLSRGAREAGMFVGGCCFFFITSL